MIILRIQNKYWQELVQLRFEIFYIDELVSQSYYYNNLINLFLAISSSGSIAAWAIWKELQLLWSIIIAISQVINAIKQFIPFGNRVKFLTEYSVKLNNLFYEIDRDWYKVANGELTEEEINNLLFEFRRKSSEIENTSVQSNYIPKDPKLIEAADKRLKAYFKKYY